MAFVIVHGKKLAYKDLGHLDYFCSICRAPRSCAARSVALVEHLYFVGVGRAEPVSEELTCGECRTVFGLPPGSVPESRGHASAPPTTPAWPREKIEERAASERRITSAGNTAMERAEFFVEPLRDLEYHAEREFRRGHFESLCAVLGLLSIVGFAASAILWTEFFERGTSPAYRGWTLAITGVSVLVIALTVYLAVRARAIIFRRHILPRWARSIARFHPTPADLEAALDAMRREKRTFVSGASAQHAATYIDRLHARGNPR